MNAPLFYLSLKLATDGIDSDSLQHLAIMAWQRTEYGNWVLS